MKNILPWLIAGGLIIYLINSSNSSTKKQVPGQTGGDENTLRGTIRENKYPSI